MSPELASIINTIITAGAGGGGVAVLLKTLDEARKRRAQKRARREREEAEKHLREAAAQDPGQRTADELAVLARVRAWAFAEVAAADGRTAERDRQVAELLTRVGHVERDFAAAVAHIRRLEDVIRRGGKEPPPWPPLESDAATSAADAP